MSTAGGFVKLYGSIITSSVWVEPHHVFRVWITLLVLADKNGYVAGTVPGIASIARVTEAECEEALDRFLEPDKYSRTPEHEGRRIECAEGGWTIVNHGKYRELRTDSQIANAERQRRHQEKKRAAESGAENETEGPNPPQESVSPNASNTPEYRVQSTEAEVVQKSSLSPAREEALELTGSNGRPDPSWPEPVMEFLRRRESGLVAWTSAFVGMLQGLGAPGGRAVTVEQIAQACIEIEQLGGEISPRRFRRVLEQVIEPTLRSGAGADAEFVAASNRLQEIASYRDPVRGQTLLAEGWRTVTPPERAAIKVIGGMERVLTAKPDQWPFVVRDYLKATRGARPSPARALGWVAR